MATSNQTETLSAFLPPTRTWFEQTLGAPTPPQAQGWPSIQRGEHTLILAPTGSGKTLAAFLCGIDQLYRELSAAPPDEGRRRKKPKPQTRLLYISPLKALNNDIDRNLRVPLAGIREVARSMDGKLPEIRVAVRSGDTPQRERQAMVRTPPHILITTPESLYLILTSPKARDLLRTVRTVIVDEIHTLAGSKRGVHLSLSLERLQQLAAAPIQRIGLSATIQPLDEVARYLGGSVWQGTGEDRVLSPRPVNIIDAGYRKALDIRVETVVEDFRNLPGDSIWPSLIPRISELIHQHKTTLIFVNNRRQAERTADRLNEQLAAEAKGLDSGLLEQGAAKGLGMFGAGTGEHADPIRAHHGSMSKETRLALETELKAGRLPALVGTSSLELGIDIGAVDLVVQLQSAKSVAQGLQRVGRAGHLVGQTSRGRIFPTHREDVMEAAAVAGGMLRGEVEPIQTPRNSLDVLAQQIVAMVAIDNWSADDLYDLLRRAYAYHDLTLRAWHAVLEMLSGRYPSVAHKELRARLVWDRVNNQLAALPGSRLLATTNGGTISDRGAFGAYLSDGKTKLGELDEEFVYETRVGDTLMLGSQVWRVTDITDDRLIVADAAGATPRMPFWRGDFPWRPYALGARVGAFRRAVAERLQAIGAELGTEKMRAIKQHVDAAPVVEMLTWLERDYALDRNSAWQVVDYVAGQLDHSGVISSDRTVLVEIFDDALGDPRMVVQAPFGGRVNGLWGLALAGALRQRTGVDVELMTNDDGILFRFPDADADFPLDLIEQMTRAEARELILQELPDSAVFGAQFRQNAARALLLPGLRGGKRTPFWLQRLRSKDLLRVVRQFDEFPILVETYRDCLEEVMDLPHLEAVLDGIRAGEIKVTVVESLTPSPVAQSLMWDFIEFYMYEWDAPKAERQLQDLSLNRDLLQDLLKDVDLAELLRPEAVADISGRLQHTAPTAQARTAEELALLFLDLGDLSSPEIAARCSVDPAVWIAQLADAGRIAQASIPTAGGDAIRWVATEHAADYAAAFDLDLTAPDLVEAIETDTAPSKDAAARAILRRFLDQSGPVNFADIRARYAFPETWLRQELDEMVEGRALAHGRFTPNQVEPASSGVADEFVARDTLEQMHRRTLSILRHEVRPVPFTAYADFLVRWQHLHAATRFAGPGALRQALQQLRAAPIVGRVWERDALPMRVANYDSGELATLCQSGELVWIGSGGADPRRGRIRFLFRGEGRAFLEPSPDDFSELSKNAQETYAFLKEEGAVFQSDLQAGLGISSQAVDAALTELVMAGLVTNDSLAALHQIMGQSPVQPSPPRGARSTLEAQLAERLGPSTPRVGGFRRPRRSELQAAQKRVRQRLERGIVAEAHPTVAQAGRWTLVHRFGVLGQELSSQEIATRQARQLLTRHGVVTRSSLDVEYGAWQWPVIYEELKRLEMRGEVRRGLFVQGLPGVQFALPEVVEQLRAGSAPVAGAEPTRDDLVLLNACDPANLYGPVMADLPLTESGEPLTFSRIPSTWLVLHRGLPRLLIEDNGANLTTTQGAEDGLLSRAVRCWLQHAGRFERRVGVQQWNDAPVLESPGQSLLEAAGFYRDYPGMTWER